MSYDIYLKEKSTGETIDLPVKHVMAGGTCCAEYYEATGEFSVKPITEAWLNITYNYRRYYSEAAEGDDRFYGEDDEGQYKNQGIRGIYGKTGAESIPMLKDMAERIQRYEDDFDQLNLKEYYDEKNIHRYKIQDGCTLVAVNVNLYFVRDSFCMADD